MENDNNLAKQAATVVSIVEDFAEKNKMNVILCISSGQEQVGCALYSGNVEENADALCGAAVAHEGVYYAITQAAAQLSFTKEHGFDIEAVHSGKSTIEEQIINFKDKLNETDCN